ncbi:MAG: hypothetical protein JWO36_7183 [Myxococcales bacterium]|nr:hypothetical protein [Myxococcales bacterium]
MLEERMRFAIGCVLVASCGGTQEPPIDPNAIDVLVLSKGLAAADRDVTLIASDGNVQTVKTDAGGHAIAMLGATATQATVYSDSMSTEGRFTMQGVAPGDHICLGCTYTQDITCTGLPPITNVHRVGQGWGWDLGSGKPYAGMEISWNPAANNPNAGGHLISPPGQVLLSTNTSRDITIVLLVRDDVPAYDALRKLSQGGWAQPAFCATSAHQ